jgi:ribosomal protein L11 methyltransferase
MRDAMSDWWQVTVSTDLESAGTEIEEVLGWRLSELCSGYYVTESRPTCLELRGWLDSKTEMTVLETFQGLVQEVDPKAKVRWIAQTDQDYDATWKQFLKPRLVGEKFLICPQWIEMVELGRLLLRTNPGMAFGTGEHQTTRMCLAALESVVKPGNSVIDIGCGSGILTVGALLLGAGHVWAVDTDPLAVSATVEHLALNNLDKSATVRLGSTEVISENAEGLVCNILAEVICAIAPELARLAKPGAWGVFSGLLITQQASVQAALEAVGCEGFTVLTEGDWACLITRFPI